MRKADMRKAIEAETPVAVAAHVERGHYPTFARKAVIVGLDEARRVYSGARHDIGGHIARDGVRVRYDEPVDNDRYSRPIVKASSYRGDEHQTDTEDCVVGPRLVVDTWEDFERKRQAEQEARRAREEAVNAAATECQELASTLTELGFSADADYHVPRTGYRGQYRGVRLSRAAARALVEHLREASS